MAEYQRSSHIVNHVLFDSRVAHHLEAVGDGVGVNGNQICAIFNHLVISSIQHDIVDVQHELVGAGEMDDGHIDVLSLIVPEVYSIAVPFTSRFCGHVGFPHDDEVVWSGVASRRYGHAEMLGGMRYVLCASDKGNLFAVKFVWGNQIVFRI